MAGATLGVASFASLGLDVVASGLKLVLRAGSIPASEPRTIATMRQAALGVFVQTG